MSICSPDRANTARSHPVLSKSPLSANIDPQLPMWVPDPPDHVEIEPSKCRYIVMTERSLHVQVDSLTDAAGAPDHELLRALGPLRRTSDGEFINAKDAIKLCQRLKLKECETLIRLQKLSFGSPAPYSERDKCFHVKLAAARQISVLQNLGLVNLRQILDFAGEKPSKIDSLAASTIQERLAWHVHIPGSTGLEPYILIVDALETPPGIPRMQHPELPSRIFHQEQDCRGTAHHCCGCQTILHRYPTLG